MTKVASNKMSEDKIVNQRAMLRDKVLFRLLKTKGKPICDICEKLKYNTRNVCMLSEDELCELWYHVKIILADAQKLCANKPDNNVITKEYRMLIQLIRIITSMALETLSRKMFIPNVLLEVVIILHSVILPQTEDKRVKNEVSFFLENWWKMDMMWKEKVILNVIKYLIECAEASPKFLKRLVDVKAALYLTKGTESSRAVLKLAQKKQLFSLDEARELMSQLLALGEPWTMDIHKHIRQQLENGERNNIMLYADVYATGWLIAVPANKKFIAEKCVHDIIFHALRTQRTSIERNKLGKNLLVFLKTLHKHPNKTVKKMVYDQYKDILWKHIEAPGSAVRCNAADVLFAAYPMREVFNSKSKIAAYTQQQHTAMTNLLKDENTNVCIAALRGISLMKKRMECVPNRVIEEWLNVILKLSKESPSSEVRLCVLFTLKEIASNFHSDDLLREFLPKFANSIYDDNSCIAEALVKLVQHVHKNTEMSYSDVVPLHSLLECVNTVDESPLLQMLVELLLHDAISLDVRKSDALDDLINFGLTNLNAMRKLLLQSDHVIDWDTSVELIKDALDMIHKNIGSCGAGSLRRQSKRIKLSNEEANERTYVLFTIVATLLTGAKENLQSSSDAEKMDNLLSSIADELPTFYEHLQDSPAEQTVLFLFSFIPPSSLSDIENIVHKFVDELRSSDITHDSIILILHVLNKWNKVDCVLKFVTEMIASALTNEKSNSLDIKQNYANFYMGCRTLKHVLRSEFQFAIMDKHHEMLVELWETLHTLKTIIEQKCDIQADSKQMKCNELILDYFNEYIRMLPLLHKPDEFDAVKQFSDLLEWTQQKVFPHIPPGIKVKKNEFSVNTIRIVFRNCISSMEHAYVTPKLCYDISLLFIRCVQLPCGIMFVQDCCTAMIALLDYGKLAYVNNERNLLNSVVPNMLSAQMIRLITYPEDVILTHTNELKMLSAVVQKFYTIMESCVKDSDRHKSYMSIVFNTAISSISKDTLKQQVNVKPKSVMKQKIPHLADKILKILFSAKKFQVVVIQILKEGIIKYSKVDMLSALRVVNKLMKMANKIPKGDFKQIVSIVHGQRPSDSKEYVDIAMEAIIEEMSS